MVKRNHQYKKSRKALKALKKPEKKDLHPQKFWKGTLEERICLTAQKRAKRKEVDFDLTPEDIIVPKKCPVLGITLIEGNNRTSDSSPTLDRIDSNKGYTKDNVWVISHRANQLKANASLEELEFFVKRLRIAIDALPHPDSVEILRQLRYDR